MSRFLALVLSLALANELAGHAGEDHGAPAAAQQVVAVGAPIAVSKETQFLLGIVTEIAQKRTMRQSLTALGNVRLRPQDRAAVAAPFGGRLGVAARRPFPTVGQTVTAGEELALVQQVLPATERITLATQRTAAEAAVAQARAELSLADRELERMRALRALVAGKQVQEAQSRAQIARANMQKAQKELALYQAAASPDEARWRSMPLSAPISGTITEVNASPGETVDAERVLVRIANLRTVWVAAAIFETDLPLLARVGKATVTSPVYPDMLLQARLHAVGSEVKPDTRTVEALFEVPNADGKLLGEMMAEIAIDTGRPVQTLAVPTGAIEEVAGQKVVFVHTRPEEFVARSIETGTRSGDHVEVRSGIHPGERIVTVGQYQLVSLVSTGKTTSTTAR